MDIKLNETQWKVFKYLINTEKKLSTQQIVADTELDNPVVMGTLQYGEEMGWVSIDENKREELIPSEDAAEIIKKGLPERRILTFLNDKILNVYV